MTNIEIYTNFILKHNVESLTGEVLERFLLAPASTKWHGDYQGGLLEHSMIVAEKLVELTKKLDLKWSRPESPAIVGLYHDLCKAELYEYDWEEEKWGYDSECIYPYSDHANRSIVMLQNFIKLNEDEIACIRYHMGAYEGKDSWNSLDGAIKKHENVLYTHLADMYASKIVGV